MRRQRRRQVLWLNRYSLLREMLIVAANEHLSRSADHLDRKAGLRYDVVLLPSANSGGFLDAACEPPFWDGRAESSATQTNCEAVDEADDCFLVRCERRTEKSNLLSSEYALPVDLMRRCDGDLQGFLGEVQ